MEKEMGIEPKVVPIIWSEIWFWKKTISNRNQEIRYICTKLRLEWKLQPTNSDYINITGEVMSSPAIYTKCFLSSHNAERKNENWIKPEANKKKKTKDFWGECTDQGKLLVKGRKKPELISRLGSNIN